MFETFYDKMLNDMFVSLFTKKKSRLLSEDIRIRKLIDTKDHGEYIVKKELIDGKEFGCDDFEAESAYAKDGGYLGDPKMAKRLVEKFGITRFEKKNPACNICTIGLNEKENKWYGWSHRAICGFKIGDKIFEEDFGNDKTLFVKHGKLPVKTMDDARQAAINFADYVA